MEVPVENCLIGGDTLKFPQNLYIVVIMSGLLFDKNHITVGLFCWKYTATVRVMPITALSKAGVW